MIETQAMGPAVALGDRPISTLPTLHKQICAPFHLCPCCKKIAIVYLHPETEQRVWRCDSCGEEGQVLAVAPFTNDCQTIIPLLPGVEDPPFNGRWNTDDRYVCRRHGSIALVTDVKGVGLVWACIPCFMKTHSPALRFTSRQAWRPWV